MRPSRRDQPSIHKPVLTREVLTGLALEPGLCVVDATIGAAGHSRQILEQIRPGGRLIGVDRDPMMLHIAAHILKAPQPDVVLQQSSYVALPDILAEHRITHVDRVLADLGLSSDQLADHSRGFSFDAEGPLDLRFDTTRGLPASELLRSLSAVDLAHILEEYGEEPNSRRIADSIIRARQQKEIRTARQLADVVAGAVPLRKRGDRHPATRVFQALRIAVNDELRHVAQLVGDILPRVLVRGGRAAIISFHSLEDRLVKQVFRDRSIWEAVTPKPVTASSAERRQNPRARSAKLRVAIRV